MHSSLRAPVAIGSPGAGTLFSAGSLPNRAVHGAACRGQLSSHPREPIIRRGNSPNTSHLVGDVRTQVVETETSERIKVETEGDGEHGSFDWERQWYPIFVVEDLNPKRPTAFTLLGKDLVVWRDGQGEWRCFQDLCPHRLAPLSEGRIEPSDGSLMCSYHGWRFDSSGKCVSIPQAKDEKAERTACNSIRSKAISYPVQIQQDLLWVWGDGSPTSFIDSAMHSPILADVHGNNKFVEMSFFMRDVLYGYDNLVENCLDPAHVPFAHHGVKGVEAKAVSYDMEYIKEDIPSEGHSGTTSDDVFHFRFKSEPGFMEFRPPVLVKYCYTFLTAFVYSVPTGPATSRVFFRLFVKSMLLTRILRFLLPRFLEHMVRNEVFDGDNMLLVGQQEALRRSKKSSLQQYFMPSSADVGVAIFRRWFETEGGNGPRCQDGSLLLDTPAPDLTKKVVFDRYDQHTKHCKSCQGALKFVEISRWIAKAFAAVSTVLLVGGIAKGRQVPLVVGGIILGLCADLWMKGMEANFKVKEYAHWEKW